jgi:hypothetical protein
MAAEIAVAPNTSTSLPSLFTAPPRSVKSWDDAAAADARSIEAANKKIAAAEQVAMPVLKEKYQERAAAEQLSKEIELPNIAKRPKGAARGFAQDDGG